MVQFKEERFCYSHLKRVIRVSGKFGKYLKDLRNGLTPDVVKHEEGVRYSYRAVTVSCGKHRGIGMKESSVDLIQRNGLMTPVGCTISRNHGEGIV
jgi:hypothetical protein